MYRMQGKRLDHHTHCKKLTLSLNSNQSVLQSLATPVDRATYPATNRLGANLHLAPVVKEDANHFGIHVGTAMTL